MASVWDYYRSKFRICCIDNWIIGLYGFIKLGRWMSRFFERKRQQTEPTAIQLRELQQN